MILVNSVICIVVYIFNVFYISQPKKELDMDSINVTKLCVKSFNCKGFKPRNYSYVKKLFEDASILLIQEHWLYNFECDNFSKILINSSYHAKSSMPDNVLLKGRPYGGTAIIYRNNLNAKITPLNTSTPRLCAVMMESNQYNLIIVCVYMPTDSTENDEEFSDILEEITSLYHQYTEYEVIIGGDFNCDETRGNDRSALLRAWRHSLGLMSPALQSDAPPTHTYRTHDGRTSLLDYVFSSEGLNQSITEFAV